MQPKTLWITRTAALLALLIILQLATRSAGQLVTGSCVNAVLALAALIAGLSSGLTVAVLSPFLAFALGVGPKLLPIVPAIAAGNAALVALICLFAKGELSPARRVLATVVAAAGKFVLLYLLVVQLLCRVLPLNEKQIATFSAMFSWPQLITALIGTAVAMCVAPIVQKAIRRG